MATVNTKLTDSSGSGTSCAASVSLGRSSYLASPDCARRSCAPHADPLAFADGSSRVLCRYYSGFDFMEQIEGGGMKEILLMFTIFKNDAQETKPKT